MKDMQHKVIAIYNSGLLLVTGHMPEGSLLFKRYMSANAYTPIAAPIINDPLLKYDNVFFFIVGYLPSIHLFDYFVSCIDQKNLQEVSQALESIEPSN